MQQSARSEKCEMVIARTFKATRELVWKAWTEPERLMAWWGPKTFTAPFIQIDLRKGGKYLYCMRSLDGKDFWSTGTIHEIVPPERLDLTDFFSDEEGNVVSAAYYGMNPDFPLESLVIVTFEENDGKTKFTLRYDDVSAIPEKDLQDMKQGWNESFDKLAEYLNGKI